MNNRASKYNISGALAERKPARAGAAASPRWGRGFIRRLLCMLLAVGLLLNSMGVAMMDEELQLDSAEYEWDSDSVQELEGDLSDLEADPSQAAGVNQYTYRLGESGEALLSDIIEFLELPIDRRDITMVVVMGGGIIYVEDLGFVEESTDLVAVEPVERPEENDYRITALRDFVEAGIVVYTIYDMFTIKLTEGWEAVPTPEPTAVPTPEPAPEVVQPTEEVIEPAEEITEPVEEITEPFEEVIEPAEEIIEPVEENVEPAEEPQEPSPLEEVDQPEAGTEEAPDEEPSEEIVEPIEEIVEPVEEITEPVEVVAEPAEEAQPEAGTEEVPGEEPSGETVEPAEEITEPIEEVVEPVEEPQEPSPLEEAQPEAGTEEVPGEEPSEETVEPAAETAEPADEAQGEPAVDIDDEITFDVDETPAEEPAEEPADETSEGDLSEAPADEPTEEPTEEPAVVWPAQSFTARAAGVSVSVEAGEGAFPEGTTMQARRVWDADTLSDIRETVAEDFVEVRRVQAVDITFYDASGAEIEPRVPISVVIRVSDIADGQEALVVHVDDAGVTRVVDQDDAPETSGGQLALNVEMPAGEGETTEPGGETDIDDEFELAFGADEFSVYAVVVTETIETRYIDAGGSTYAIEVGYGEDAGIPAGAGLEVWELTGDEADEYAAGAAEALGAEVSRLAYAKALDIAIVANGERVRPQAPVTVSVRLLDAPEGMDEQNIGVVHFGDEPEAVDCALNGDAVEFETDGFSVFVIAYTVDFHWNGYTYSIAGESEILLSALLEELGVTEIGIGDVAAVSFTDETLVRVDALDGDWLLTSLAPFDSEEALVLTLKNGQNVEIAVTDAQTTDTTCPYCNSFDVTGWEEKAIPANSTNDGVASKLYWKIDGNNCLWIHCDADVKDSYAERPWDNNTNRSSVTSANVSGNISRIYKNMFLYMYGISSMTINCPNIQTIEAGAFQDTGANAKQLVSIDFSGCSQLETIKNKAFYNCFKGTYSVSFKDCAKLSSIETQAFLDQPRSLRYIDFSGCVALSQIASDAFMGGSNQRLMVHVANFQGTPITSIDNIYIHPYDVKTYNLSRTQIETLDLKDFKALTELWLPKTLTNLTITGETDAKKISTIYYDGTEAEWIEKGFDQLFTNPNKTVYYAVGSMDLKITAPTQTREYDGTALTDGAYTVEGLADGHVLSVNVKGSQTVVGSSDNVPSGATIADASGKDVSLKYRITYVPGKLTVTPKQVTVSAEGMTKTYDEPDPAPKITGLVDGESESLIAYTYKRDEGEDVNDGNPYTVTLSVEEELQGNYRVTCENGTLTITPAPVTLTAASGWAVYDGNQKTLNGFTAQGADGKTLEGLAFPGVSASASGTDASAQPYPVTFQGVTLNATKDSTGNYVVTETVDGEFYITELLKKEIVGISGNRVSYQVTVNELGLRVNDGQPLTLKDTLKTYNPDTAPDITNQTLDYSSISIQPAGSSVTYDYSGYTGTFALPDATALTVTYTTRVLGGSGEECVFGNDAVLLDSDGQPLADASVTRKQTIYPTASDVSTDVYMVKLYVYGGANMEKGLSGASFRLLDANQRPMTYRKGDAAGETVVFTTDDRGYANVQLDMETQGVAIEKNTLYYLEMTQPPQGYKRDVVLYSFMITDDASYDSGDIYTYFNGDTMKVRLYPEQSGLNVALRLSGNYALTEDQKENIAVVLQRQTESGDWEAVERHLYGDFNRGILAFTAGLEVGATYRVTEENARHWSLDNAIISSTSYSLGVGVGEPVQGAVPPVFTVTEDNYASGFSVAITNVYEQLKMTLTKMDKRSGAKLAGAVFTVYKAVGDAEVRTYTTDADGVVEITSGAEYDTVTLYYVVETEAPQGYLLPLEPEKIYFHFCNDDVLIPTILAGLPEGGTAVNLSETYESLTLDNQKAESTVPVIKTWQGNDWPENVSSVVVGLYSSVNGSEPEAVTDDKGPMTVTLTAGDPYASFDHLPMRDGQDCAITYSVKEEHVYDNSSEPVDILDSYVQEYGVSDSGIYVVRNKEAVSLTVNGEWVDAQGKVTDNEVIARQSDVTFDVYRTTATISDEARADGITNDEMTAFVATLEKVREGLSFSAEAGRLIVNDLDKCDDGMVPYNYFILETVPSFGDETYAVNEGERTVTVQNPIAPETRTLTVKKDALVDDPRPDAVNTEFEFTLLLKKGDRVIRSYPVADGIVTDWDGQATFALKPEMSQEFNVPVGVTITVTEAANPEYTVQASLNGDTPTDGRERGYDVAEDAATITFTNTLRVICKVAYEDTEGTVEKPFESLKSALAFIRDNSDIFNGTATIQMLEDYEIPATDGLDVQAEEKITLTTAKTAADDPTTRFPFKTDRTSDTGTAIITRGGAGGSMLKNAGTLRVDNLILDGAMDSGLTAEGDGGLINSTGTLNLTGVTLRNSRATGAGGALYADGTVNLTDSRITGNAAASGSAIYLAAGSALNISDSRIEGNTGASDGALVAKDLATRINLSGNVVIFDNTDASGARADLWFDVDSDNIVNVVGPGLGTGAKIGIRAMDPHRQIGDQFATAEYGFTDNLNGFISDEYGYRGKLRDGASTNIVWDGLTLTLSKVVPDKGANANDTFTITITSAAIRKNSYTIDGNYDNTVTPARNVPGTIVLRNVRAGNRISISPLPVGDYTITEAESNYAPDFAGKAEGGDALEIRDGAFSLLASSEITVTNARRLAKVNLTKTTADRLKAQDEPQPFAFTLKLADADGTLLANYALYEDDDNPANNIVTDANGVATLTLSPTNNQSAAREFLAPVGATMTITEAYNPDYRITASAVTMPAEGEGTAIEDLDTASDNAFAFTVTDDGADVTIANERRIAEITLSDEIVDKVSTAEVFDVTVTLTRRDGDPAANYTLYEDAENPENNIVTGADGKAVIRFEYPEDVTSRSYTLAVPEGTKLEVEQAPVTREVGGEQVEIYETTRALNGAEIVDAEEPEEGEEGQEADSALKVTIEAVSGTDRSIEFINTRKMQTVTVTNTVNGYAGNAQSFEYTATVTDGGEDQNDYNSNGFTDGTMTFELLTDQSQTLTVPYGAELTIKQTFVVGYETTVQHGSAAAVIATQDKFTVAEDVTVAFTNTQLINIVLENKTTADMEFTVVVGTGATYGTKMYRVNDAQDGQAPEASFNSATHTAEINVAAGKTAILEVDHPFDSGNEKTQDYTVSGATPTNGYYYTITNAASYHEYAEPYITRIYNAASFTVKGKLRFSNTDTTITVAAQPLVSFDANGGVWTTEMEGYNDRDGDRQVYQMAVDAGKTVSKPTDPVYPTGEGFALLGWTTDAEFAKASHAAGDDISAKAYDFNTAVTEPVTLYAVWTRPQRDTRVVTVQNSTGAELTVSVTLTDADGPKAGVQLTDGVTTDENGVASIILSTDPAGEAASLSVPDGAKLVLAADNNASCGAYSTVFTDGDTVNNSFTINTVNRDGTVVFIAGICKITDASGKTLYDGAGKPAVYMMLSDAFTAYVGTLYADAAHTTEATPAAVKLLVDEYTIQQSAALALPKATMTLTTASATDADFPYAGTRASSTIYRYNVNRGNNNSCFSMTGGDITLTDIILDGGAVFDASGNNKGSYAQTKTNGGLINVTGGTLNITTGAELRNNAFQAYSDGSYGRGGGIYINGGTLNVTAGLFSNLRGRRGGAICAEGSAVLNVTGSDGGIQFVDCVATSNNTSQEGFGGAIYHEGTGNISVNGGSDLKNPGVVFTRCVGNQGGGIYTPYTGIVNISGCRFEECRTIYANKNSGGAADRRRGGGGIAITKADRFTVAYCSFFRCDSMSSGSGILGITQDKYDSIVDKAPDAIIDHCVFENCNSRSQGGGSAVYPYSEGSKTITNLLLIENCTYTDCAVGTENSSAGAMQTYMPYFDLVNTDVTNCWAGKEGGAINQWMAPLQDSRLTVTDCKFTGCRSEARFEPNGNHHGGAISTRAYTVKISGSTFDSCVSPTKHGGAVATVYDGGTTGSSTTIEGTTFRNCSAKTNGGALSVQTYELTMKNTQFIDCVSYNRGGAVSIEKYINGCFANVENCTFTRCSSVDGGAFWSQSDIATFTGCTFSDCVATGNGGAIYSDRKNPTFAGCTINKCVATGNGGGIYLKSNGSTQATISAVTTEDGTVGSITNCQANKGSAVYAEFKTIFSGVSITDNTVVDKDSGAVHGWNLQFEGDTVVQDNVCSNDSRYDHDVLYFDNNNGRINTTATGLGENANIGVYVTDAQLNDHGLESKPFGTHGTHDDNENFGAVNLDYFFNDRDTGLHGYKLNATDTKIYWGYYLCKITDAAGNTLTRPNGRDAVYQRLTFAFDEFTKVVNEAGETGKAVYIKMLVENYDIQQTGQIENFPEGADITLSTEAFTDDAEAVEGQYDGKHPYRGTPGTVCTISRTNSTNQLFKLTKANTTFQLENITLDGRKDKTATQGDYRLIEATNGTVVIDGGTTLRYGRVTGGEDVGGAIYANTSSKLIVNSRLGNDVRFENCYANWGGGAIGLRNNASLSITCEDADDGSYSVTSFSDCNATRGGAIVKRDDSATASFAIDGAAFTNCYCVNEGGAIFNDNKSGNTSTTISRAEFTNCYATQSTQYASGGAVATRSDILKVEDSRFVNCYTRFNGGAINHGINNSSYNRAQTIIVNTVFENCRNENSGTSTNAPVGGAGGAVYTQAKAVTLEGCEFIDTKACTYGGALYCQNANAVTTLRGVSFDGCSVTGNNSYGGAVYSSGTEMTLQDLEAEGTESKSTEIKNCTAMGYSGAVYMGSDNSVLNITGNTVISGCYANQGGAIYLKNKVTLNIGGSPEFTRNGYATINGSPVSAEKGACIYLAEGSRVNFNEGSPRFSYNNLTTQPRITNGGNTNLVRQDLYMAGYSGKESLSIHVAGELTGDTIWVWPENSPHRLASEQFAKLDNSVSDATLQKFRNALPDGAAGTGCSDGEYLAGVHLNGNTANAYWSKMYNISFRKIDNKSVAVPGAEFTLFSDAACSVEVVKAVSADGETDTNAQGELLDKGTVDFVSVPIGIYYMKETRGPESFKANDTVYLVLVGTPSLSRNESNQAFWDAGGPLDVTNAKALVASNTTGAGKYYGIYPLSDGKANVSRNLASANVGIVNVRNDYEAEFLKVDSSGLALPNAAFTIYAQDGDKTDPDGYPVLELWSRDGETYPEPVSAADGTSAYKRLDGTTVPKGVVYFRELPKGTYYLVESYYPERNGNKLKAFYVEDDRLLRLEVDGVGGFTLSQWQEGGTYTEVEQENGYYVVANTDAVCKLTDGNDNLLFELGHDGKLLPAIYATLEEGFDAAQTHALVNARGQAVADDADLKLKVLKDFTISHSITYTSAHALTLTTAERTVSAAQKSAGDKYEFATTRSVDISRAEIKRGYSESGANSNDGALIIVDNDASLTLENINLNGQKGQYNGRAVHVKSGALAIGEDAKLQNFRQAATAASTDANDIKGGAVLLESGTTLTVDGGVNRKAEFVDNEAVNSRGSGSTAADGGAIAAGPLCRITIRNALFSGNAATAVADEKGNGGAISLTDTKGAADVTALSLQNVAFTGNTASYCGGALRTGENCQVTLDNNEFTGNSAVTGDGGAVAVLSANGNASELTVTGGTFYNNTAKSGKGGAIKIGGYGTLTIQGNAILGASGRGNRAKDGGAIVVAPNATAKVVSATLRNNEATENGGAVYVEGANGSLTIDGAGTLSNNSADNNGGAIYAAAGASVSVAAGASLTDNDAAEDGGAVYVGEGAVLTMTGGSITGNGGGGIGVAEGSQLNFSGDVTVTGNAREGEVCNVHLSVDSRTIINTDGLGDNAAIGVYVDENRDNAGYSAGREFGSYTGDDTYATLYRFTNDKNGLTGTTGGEPNTVYWVDYVARVSNDGGATWTYHEYLTTTIEQGLLKEGAFDRANGLGGAVVVETLLESHDRYTLAKGYTFDADTDITLQTTSDIDWNPEGFTSTLKRGGATDSLFTGKGALTLADITLDGDNQQIDVNGGLVHVVSGTLTVKAGATLQNSVTTGCGGAIYLEDGVGLTMTGGTVSGSRAKLGGGICAAENTAQLNIENRVRENAKVKVTVRISNVTFSGNTATNSGGGILIGEGVVAELSKTTMIDNQALGTDRSLTGTFMEGWGNGVDYTYGCGGGLFADRNTTVYISGCTIGEEDHPNTADSSYYSGGILEYVGASGGGIFLCNTGTWPERAAARVYLDNTTVQYNEARYGGGIGTVQNTYLSVKDSTIANNKASVRGGGIQLRAGNAYLLMTDSSVVDNQATEQGGGIWTSSGDPDRVVLQNVGVSGNTARLGGGAYASNITLRSTQITGNWTTNKDNEGPLIDGAGGLYLTQHLVIDDLSDTHSNIMFNYTKEFRQEPSDLHLPYSKDTKTNNADSVRLKSEFTGKLMVTNPGRVNSNFGTSDRAGYYKDYPNVEDWEKANIVSENDSMFYGRRRDTNTNELYWYQECICKITDDQRAPLYMREVSTDEEGKEQVNWVEAVYMFLFDATTNSDMGTTESAVGTLNLNTPLYQDKNVGSLYTGDKLHIEMLVDYGINTPVRINTDRDIILTTAVPKGNSSLKGDYGYRVAGKTTATLHPGIAMGVLNRNGQEAFMFRLQGNTRFTLENITLDGGVKYTEGSDRVQFNGDVPEYDKDQSFISKKDGFLVQLTNSSTLTLGDGATLQNAYTTHRYGGAAVCFGQNTSNHKREMIMLPGSRIYRCFAGYTPGVTRIEGMKDDYGGYGGAISFNRVGSDDTLTIRGGTIEQCWAEEKGGAIYLDNNHSKLVIDVDEGATFTMMDCYAPKGGGIYLDDRGTGGDFNPSIGSTLKIEGALSFSNNYGTGYDGSHTDIGLANLEGKTNGTEAILNSGNVRQDIYVNSISGDPARAITVTGRIDAPAGSIRLWASTDPAPNGKEQSAEHYKDTEQFAVFAAGLVGVDGQKAVSQMPLTGAESSAAGSDPQKLQQAREDVLKATMRAFRNALDDDTTKNGDTYPYDTYLTGNPGEVATNLYWGPATDGFDFSFMKVDGNGDPLAGAEFKLYSDADCATEVQDSDTVTVTQENNEDIYRDTAGNVLEKGEVPFRKVPAGVYYMRETTVPDGYVNSIAMDADGNPIPETYVVLVGDAALKRPTTITGTPWDPVLEDITDDDVEKQTGTGADAKQYAIFRIDPETGRAEANTDIAAYGLVNISEYSRKVILRKVDGAYVAKPGETFTLTSFDGRVIEPALKSKSSGVIWIGKLPYGLYRLEETSQTDKIFEFWVDKDGIREKGTDPDATKDDAELTNQLGGKPKPTAQP